MAKEKIKSFDPELIEKYYSGELKFKELCEIYKVSVPTMYKYFDKFGVKRRLNIVKESIKHDFFKKINSEEKAYILGFYIADGSVYKGNSHQGYKFSIGISALDIDILEKIRDILSPNANINFSDERINNYGIKTNTMCKLSISSKDIVNTLCDLGLGENKTYLSKSIINIVPENLMFSFIRGYFDGDGHIGYSKVSKKHITKQNEEKNYNYINYNFNIISLDHSILLEISNFLESKNFTITKRIDKDCLIISIHKKSEIESIFNLLYKDATIFMNRKYNKFKEILEIPN